MCKIVKTFLKDLEERNMSKETVKTYHSNLKLWIRFQFSNSDLDSNCSFDVDDIVKITTENLQDYIERLRKTKKSSSSISVAINTLRSFYNFLVESGMISENPAKKLKIPKIEAKLPKYLTEEEAIKMLNSVEKIAKRNPEKEYAILTVFLNTGLRLSELININVDDITGDVLKVKGKGSREREIVLSDSCLAAIKSYLRVRRNIFDTDALFVSDANARYSISGIQFMVEKYLKAIKRRDLSVHKLRHTALSNILKNGADLRTVQALAGHKDIKTTAIYTHIDNTQKRKAVNNTALAGLKMGKH